jgi:pimeloyl-ACP methyl ester carboxylesterase/DNA-binding SARP family transcriptional activator
VARELRPLRLRPKGLALLAWLALEGPAERAVLADLIFPETEDARAALRWHLTYLRAHLPQGLRQHLVVTPQQVAFDGPTDVVEFEVEAQRLVARPGAVSAAEVLSLYRGDLCSGLTVSASPVFDNWLYVRQEAARRVFRRAATAAARHALAAGDVAQIVGPLARLIAIDPYYEEAHWLLIDAYEALGRGDAAAASYDRYRRILRQDLQTVPPSALAERFEVNARVHRVAPRDTFVTLPKVTLHVVDWPGEGPAILGIHGSTLSAYALTALAERLAPPCRFVAPDLRGHGFSDKPAGGYTVQQHVEDVCGLIDALGLRRPFVLGFSMGGAIAVLLAKRLACSGLILLDGVVGNRAFSQNAAAQVMPSQRDGLMLRVGGFDEYLTRWRSNVTMSGFSGDAERILERTIHYELAPLPDGTYRGRALVSAFEQTWASVLRSDTLGALAEVRCPTLIAQATRPWIDGRPYLTDDVIAEQRRAASNAQVFVAAHSTHPMLARDPEPAMVGALREFVTRIQHG